MVVLKAGQHTVCLVQKIEYQHNAQFFDVDTDMSTQNFTTFGFRGEALSAIRRVCASMSIVTRSADDQNATNLSFAQQMEPYFSQHQQLDRYPQKVGGWLISGLCVRGRVAEPISDTFHTITLGSPGDVTMP